MLAKSVQILPEVRCNRITIPPHFVKNLNTYYPSLLQPDLIRGPLDNYFHSVMGDAGIHKLITDDYEALFFIKRDGGALCIKNNTA